MLINHRILYIIFILSDFHGENFLLSNNSRKIQFEVKLLQLFLRIYFKIGIL